jgi:murein L,D-transpeptidase YcbB/YkuD
MGVHRYRLALRGLAVLGWMFSASGYAADDALVLRLRDRVEQASSANSARARDVAAFYAQRGYAPAWRDTERLAALATAVGSTHSDGLDPQAYHYGRLAAAQAVPANAATSDEERIALDLLATDAYLQALHDLHWGKLDPARIDPNFNFAPPSTERDAWQHGIAAAVDSADIDDIFAQARPQHAAYARLRGALQKLRDIEAAGGWPGIDDGPTLKQGDAGPRVASLRRRLVLGGYLDEEEDNGGDRFDETLETALREFQTEQYLSVDGRVGVQTRSALNLPVQARIDQVRVNLERARWLLPQVQGDAVVVDIAGFKVTYFHDGQPAWSTRAQVGLPYRSTPSFKSRIETVTFNPTWTVPPTILTEDLLPKIRRNPASLAANRIRVFDGDGRERDPSTVDWNHPRGIVLRQDAGFGNSLGRVAIRFPNPYGVYMHDTPHQELFAEERRAFSSGCIRIERPLELVERLLADMPGWNREKIDAAIATGETRSVALDHPVPILILYWSVDTHDGKRIAFKPDIYGKDAAILRELDRPRAEAAVSGDR